MSEWWILGNAPSLTDEQIHEAATHTMCVCNEFYFHPEFTSLDIDWWLLSDQDAANEPFWSRLVDAYARTKCMWMVHPDIPLRGDRVLVVGAQDTGVRVPMHHDLTRPVESCNSVVASFGVPLAIANGATKIVFAGVDLVLDQPYRHFHPEYDTPHAASVQRIDYARKGMARAIAYAKEQGVEVECRGLYQDES